MQKNNILPEIQTLVLLNYINAGYLDDFAHQESTGLSKATDSDEIAALRSDLLRFAQLQLNDSTMAEDVVHEAINAALASDKFSGRGRLKSWVFAILRNKIVDLIREQHKVFSHSYREGESTVSEDAFNEKGFWKKNQQPANWQLPESTLANQQFWNIFELCLNQLPANTGRVFMMREHLGLSINEICLSLCISESNCWVIMHRARMQLRSCLEHNFIEKNTLQME